MRSVEFLPIHLPKAPLVLVIDENVLVIDENVAAQVLEDSFTE